MNCVVDLDGTIVFAETAEIAIPGRSRCSYISAATASWLQRIGDVSNLYIATARNGASVAGFVRALPQIRFAGFVLEGGLVQRTDIFAPPLDFPPQIEFLKVIAAEYPAWELVSGYEKMICCVASAETETLQLVRELALLRKSTSEWRSHRERHKTFIYPSPLCKVAGLKQLGVEVVHFAAADDEIYDATLLASAERCFAPRSASPAILQLVQARCGSIATSAAHQGAAEMLEQIYRELSAHDHKSSDGSLAGQ